MAKQSARNCYVVYAGRDFSGDSNNVDLPFTVDTIAIPVFGINYKQYIDTLQDAKISIGAWWDNATAATDMDATLYTKLRGGTFPWTIIPQGSASGRISYSGQGILSEYSIAMPVEGATAAKLTIQNSGSITRALAS